MKLYEGDFVQYRGHKGVIDFIDRSYCVLQLPPNDQRSPARLLIFSECQNEIQVLESKAVKISNLQIVHLV